VEEERAEEEGGERRKRKEVGDAENAEGMGKRRRHR
jgi:hypothetical protein